MGGGAPRRLGWFDNHVRALPADGKADHLRRAFARSTCRAPNAGPDAPTFKIVTTPNAQQQRALDLIQDIHV